MTAATMSPDVFSSPSFSGLSWEKLSHLPQGAKIGTGLVTSITVGYATRAGLTMLAKFALAKAAVTLPVVAAASASVAASSVLSAVAVVAGGVVVGMAAKGVTNVVKTYLFDHQKTTEKGWVAQAFVGESYKKFCCSSLGTIAWGALGFWMPEVRAFAEPLVTPYVESVKACVAQVLDVVKAISVPDLTFMSAAFASDKPLGAAFDGLTAIPAETVQHTHWRDYAHLVDVAEGQFKFPSKITHLLDMAYLTEDPKKISAACEEAAYWLAKRHHYAEAQSFLQMGLANADDTVKDSMKKLLQSNLDYVRQFVHEQDVTPARVHAVIYVPPHDVFAPASVSAPAVAPALSESGAVVMDEMFIKAARQSFVNNLAQNVAYGNDQKHLAMFYEYTKKAGADCSEKVICSKDTLVQMLFHAVDRGEMLANKDLVKGVNYMLDSHKISLDVQRPFGLADYLNTVHDFVTMQAKEHLNLLIDRTFVKYGCIKDTLCSDKQKEEIVSLFEKWANRGTVVSQESIVNAGRSFTNLGWWYGRPNLFGMRL